MENYKERQTLYETIVYLTQRVKKLEAENEALKESLKSYQKKEEMFYIRPINESEDPNEAFLKNQRY